ncbi:MAG: nucleotidyltransferase domain-containing protein [ANME-2 cluster archaeon]|nr:nucleotidyltransferase domain-containing protein [ANME-2 cluster archaeon]MDF1531478.1 nucleotidyltransferase domain-containing protein [ANME-2 cluster archaeon]
MRHKTATMGQPCEIIYDTSHWELLKVLRGRAASILDALERAGLECFIYGSLARGDVSTGSDIDIIIPGVVQSFRVELALDDIGITGRKLVQATPGALVKAHVHLSQKEMVTFPLTQPTERELDFYAFGGMIGAEGLEDVNNNRVPGVDKRLMLIEPIAEGHAETPLSDITSGMVAKRLGIGQQIVDERIRVLKRRAKVGTTGVYLDRPLAQDEGFEAVLEQIIASDSLVRRRVKNRRRR